MTDPMRRWWSSATAAETKMDRWLALSWVV
jgi:hypothetical protein